MRVSRSNFVLTAISVGFLLIALSFVLELRGRHKPLPPIPEVDPSFTEPSTVRHSLSDLIRIGEDTTFFECYLCHDEDASLTLNFDDEFNVILPEEHEDIKMMHGQHNRNNNCFNCHNESNLEALQTRDEHELKIQDSSLLCASCHGPTYRDWEAGIHGRSSGYWDRSLGPVRKQDCASCHNPHHPSFPPFKPAPGPHNLRQTSRPEIEATH